MHTVYNISDLKEVAATSARLRCCRAYEWNDHSLLSASCIHRVSRDNAGAK